MLTAYALGPRAPSRPSAARTRCLRPDGHARELQHVDQPPVAAGQSNCHGRHVGRLQRSHQPDQVRARKHARVEEVDHDLAWPVRAHSEHLRQARGVRCGPSRPPARAHVWGPPGTRIGLRDRLGRYLSAPLSPIEIRELPAQVEFHSVPGGTWQIGPASVTAALVCHRGPTLGYRIVEGDASVCYLPDHEPGLGTALHARDSQWISGHALADRASLLIHDGQYTDQQYTERQGWGHSSITDALAFATRARPDQLVLTHHDPAHTDRRLDVLADLAAERWETLGHHPDRISLAAEGLTLEVPGREPASAAHRS